jgi:hypothetical protein
MFYFCLILILSHISTRLLTGQNLIISVKPTFEKTTTGTTSTKAIIHFQVIDNYIHEITYQLYISEFNTPQWNTNTAYFRNWDYTNDKYFELMRNNEAYWGPWTLAYNGKNRITTLTGLNTSMLY